MGTCAGCRYCADDHTAVPAERWPHPARWFDQPCVHCSHRLRAHDPGVPRAMDDADLLAAGAPQATGPTTEPIEV